ncbi:endolytic transglycosylase MltG [Streptomyces sp. SID9913]|uniref:endolytic transglycosylase MltG n=1 Tax=Streptomyces sp. SID9913 TaxID=2706117 RepID=UPI0013DB43AE|nr:endolytic transglycosylase MltG [Streptomyces sp. SID9913]NED18294.1 endolytic transglycosylase MltG [Streptomyces sp. SID9913]
MTEYGRGQGSEPWHPDDPLYGDGGWSGQQAPEGPQSYGGQQQYPQQPQAQQQYGEWGTAEQGDYGGQQQYPQQYDQYGRPYDQQQYNQQQQQHHQQHPYDQQQYDQYGRPYAAQQHQQHQQQYDSGGWQTGAHPQDPYAAGPDPYGQQTGAYSAQQADYYGTPEAYPPPEPPGRRGTRPESEPEPEPEPEGRTDWDPGPDQGEHAFFSGSDDDDDDEPDDAGRGERRGRGGKEKKKRGGCACLVVALVLGGGVVGVSYFGWQFYQDRFGGAEDFAGDGNGQQVTVSIPKGAFGNRIGQLLKDAGVVKSVDAFVAAQASNPEGKSIQDGVYTLQKQMSAESAVALMLSPKSRNNLVIAEGKRNAEIYALIDQRLEVDKGTTAKVAEEDWEKLGLPDWAKDHEKVKDPLEGFLFPSSYGVSKGQKPEEVLKRMVEQATRTYEKLGVEKKAESLGLENPWQLITVASLVQAEGTSHSDFRKMAEVIYNRLEPGNTETNGMLEFDSTYNYIKNQSKIDLSLKELRNYDNPYNTYFYKGLPPGPIGNPGEDAVKGALKPTDDGWFYFISMDGKTSKFTKTNAEHQKLVDEWNASRKN